MRAGALDSGRNAEVPPRPLQVKTSFRHAALPRGASSRCAARAEVQLRTNRSVGQEVIDGGLRAPGGAPAGKHALQA